MESTLYHNQEVVRHTLTQLSQACEMIMEWNKNTKSVDDYVYSPQGMQVMAASCMLIESIGEGIKKIDRRLPDFLVSNAPEVAWKDIKGLRDHIAHGYFNLDADIIFDVAINEVPDLHKVFKNLASLL